MKNQRKKSTRSAHNPAGYANPVDNGWLKAIWILAESVGYYFKNEVRQPPSQLNRVTNLI